MFVLIAGRSRCTSRTTNRTMSNPGLQSTVPPAVVIWLHPDYSSCWRTKESGVPCSTRLFCTLRLDDLQNSRSLQTFLNIWKLDWVDRHSCIHFALRVSQSFSLVVEVPMSRASCTHDVLTERSVFFIPSGQGGLWLTAELDLNLWMLDVSADYRLHLCFNSTSILPICLQLGSTAWRWTALCRWFRRTTCTWPLTSSYWLFSEQVIGRFSLNHLL